MSPKLTTRDNDPRFKKKSSLETNAKLKAKGSTQFCLAEFDEQRKLCGDRNPVYNWSDRDNGGFWKRTWELMQWVFLPSQSGKNVECYQEAIKNLRICLGTDVSARTRIFDYTDDWLIPHKMGNCSGIVVPTTQGKKILGCDGRTEDGITNPRYNQSKGKVMNCDTDLPSYEWCACPGYPIPNTESVWNLDEFRCKCRNPAEVPHFHYQHSLTGSDGRPITCCGPPCDYGYEYDCIDRSCKKSLYNFED